MSEVTRCYVSGSAHRLPNWLLSQFNQSEGDVLDRFRPHFAPDSHLANRLISNVVEICEMQAVGLEEKKWVLVSNVGMLASI